ncbi:MAG: PaREP1 family protein [Chloroflexota bacterium]
MKERVQKHKQQSLHYFENALRFIEAGDAEKASEFLWGSMTQALKAVAANKDISLKSHESIRKFAYELAFKALQDESIWMGFKDAQSLHSNFYETGLLLDDVKLGVQTVRRAVYKLLALVSES